MVYVLLAYGGWNDAAFFIAEMRDRRRIWLALVLGTTLVTVVYLLVNAAYLRALGFEGARQSHAIAADTLERALGHWGASAMSLLVMISALGAVNGLIFAGSRVYASLGADYGLFGWLARRHPRLNSPVWSLTPARRCGGDDHRGWRCPGVSRSAERSICSGRARACLLVGRDGFGTLLRDGAVFWLFFLLTSLSLFVLRLQRSRRAPDV